MNLSIIGAQFIAKFEGFSSKPYLDSVGVPTIGYGSTIYPNGKAVTMKDPAITEKDGLTYLLYHNDKRDSAYINKLLPELTQTEYDAIASFVYNLGHVLDKSTLLNRIQSGVSCNLIEDAFKMWDKAGGKVLAGLLKRRTAEGELYCKGDYALN